ncbi:MAG: acyl-CoA thioesterase, partial [Actinomycetota bacterium]|nr:acyl-CoA thioesterase [Actinomycetota bacterium]
MPRYHAAVPMRWSDMDAFGHVNNVMFLTYLEEARVEMFAELAVEVGEVGEANGVLSSGVVVASSSIDYHHPLVHRHKPVPIDVWISRIGGASFHLGYEVHDDDGAIVYARARSVLVPYDFDRGAPRRLAPFERAFLERYFEAE